MYKKICLLLLIVLSLPATLHAGESIRCATTVATRNSGLLEYLLPIFMKETGIEVRLTVAADSAAVLALAQQGKADIVLVHNQDLEKQLVDEGAFVDREEIMYDDYVILGPKDDPAGLKNIPVPLAAFNAIRSTKALFLSRGDNSATNMRENRIWATTGAMPAWNDTWYRALNKDMSQTILMAAEKQAYTLADRATWLRIQNSNHPNLDIVVQGDPSLFKQYGILIVNAKNEKYVNYQSAMNFEIWITSPRGQQVIGDFKDKLGNTLFTPNAR